ncbi:MAG: HDOD domain-containing protein [Limisphaerales bacterium]
MTAHQMLSTMQRLPPVSPAGLKLVGLLRNQEIGNDRVVSAVEEDPVLTAKLLRVCNAPGSGAAEPVSSVEYAVLLLGHWQIFQIVTALAFRELLNFPAVADAPEGAGLWRHSLLAASAAELAFPECPDISTNGSTAFTAALLHDIGKIVISQFLNPEALLAIRQRVARGASAFEAERAVLETDHAEVGGSLLHMWHLPAPITEAVALHHHPVLAPKPEPSSLTSFADRVAHRADAALHGLDPGLNEQDAQLLEALGLTPEQVEELIHRVCQSCEAPRHLTLAA